MVRYLLLVAAAGELSPSCSYLIFDKLGEYPVAVVTNILVALVWVCSSRVNL